MASVLIEGATVPLTALGVEGGAETEADALGGTWGAIALSFSDGAEGIVFNAAGGATGAIAAVADCWSIDRTGGGAGSSGLESTVGKGGTASAAGTTSETGMTDCEV